MSKEKLITMINKAITMEHAARIQYLTHVECVSGLGSASIIARLKEIASDEKEHEDIFREMLGGYLGGIPSMEIATTHPADGINNILETNLKDEKEAVDFYSEIMKELKETRDELKYEYYQLEHNLRHVIMDEQEHISEIKLLLGL